MSVFRAYDVRGVYPDELNEGLASHIARATAVFLKAKRLVIGRDGRNSSPSLHKAVIDALVKEGIEVLDIGLCTSPWFYFAIVHQNADGGLMVTASHNPKNYNGLKIQREKSIPLNVETGLQEIEDLALKGDFTDKEGGSVKEINVIDDYVVHVKRFAHDMKPLKIVLDTSNGPSALSAPRILKGLGLEVVHICKEIDGNFPDHGPNPLKGEVVEFLGKTVQEHQADLGVVYDADADRAFFVDETGRSLTGEEVYCIMVEDALEKHKGAAVVSDVRFGWSINEIVNKLGGKNILTRVGRSFIYHCMKDNNAILAGELSGHFYFLDNYYCDSSIISTILVLNKLSSSGKKLSQLVERKYFCSGEINFKVNEKDGAIEEIEKMFPGGKVDKRDGVRIDFDDWWFILRKSNTEPLIRLVAEAKTKELLDEHVKKISDYLKSLG